MWDVRRTPARYNKTELHCTHCPNGEGALVPTQAIDVTDCEAFANSDGRLACEELQAPPDPRVSNMQGNVACSVLATVT
jgi:hypothetical protein